MSKYPLWWNTTITLYNKYEDPQTQLVTWYRHVISDCFYRDISNSILVGKTLLDTKNIRCRIPVQDNFVEKYLWINKTDSQRASLITLGIDDIIVKGEVTDTIDEYTSGSRASDIVAKYKKLQGCLQIDEVAINIGPGRCDEHYYVRGV